MYIDSHIGDTWTLAAMYTPSIQLWFPTHSWNQDNHPKAMTDAGITMFYDAFGRMVEKVIGSTYQQTLISPVGPVALMSQQNLTQFRMPLPGGDTAITGVNFYHADHLGSVPLISSRVGRASIAARLFAPYGESYNSVGSTGNVNFTGDNQDLVAGTFDTPNRELNPTQGRWISPDPAHGSWNAYSYSTNPLGAIDPTGLNATEYPLCGCGSFGNGDGVFISNGDGGGSLGDSGGGSSSLGGPDPISNPGAFGINPGAPDSFTPTLIDRTGSTPTSSASSNPNDVDLGPAPPFTNFPSPSGDGPLEGTMSQFIGVPFSIKPSGRLPKLGHRGADGVYDVYGYEVDDVFGNAVGEGWEVTEFSWNYAGTEGMTSKISNAKTNPDGMFADWIGFKGPMLRGDFLVSHNVQLFSFDGGSAYLNFVVFQNAVFYNGGLSTSAIPFVP